MPRDKIYAEFSGRLVIVGFGSIGQGVLPLLLRHIAMTPAQITIVTAEERGRAEAEALGVAFRIAAADARELSSRFSSRCSAPAISCSTSRSRCRASRSSNCASAKGALYLDTCIEPWPGGYTDPTLSPSLRSNYALRESALALRARTSRPARPRC